MKNDQHGGIIIIFVRNKRTIFYWQYIYSWLYIVVFDPSYLYKRGLVVEVFLIHVEMFANLNVTSLIIMTSSDVSNA